MSTSPADLFRRLETGDWPPIILITGDDEAGRRRVVEQLVHFLPPEDQLAGVDRFESDVALARIFDAARTPSLLGGRRLVLATEPSGLGGSPSDAQRRAWVEFLDHPSETATLVVNIGKADRRLEIVKRLERAGAWIDCPLPREREMAGWILDRARERGIELSLEGARLLADAVGTGTATAERELDKLALVGPRDGGKVDPAVVEDLLGPGRAVGAFALEDALLSGNSQQALEIVNRRLSRADTGTPLALLGQMAGICRRLAVASGVAARGGGAEQIKEALGCHPFTASKYSQAAQRVGSRAAQALAACVAADGRLKSGGDPLHALASIVLALAPSRSGTRR